jgi:hypothetical protein
MLLYKPDFVRRVGFSSLDCRRFNEGAPGLGSLSKCQHGLMLRDLISAVM